MKLPSTMIAFAALACTLAWTAATAQTLTDAFFDLVENTCLPAIENARAPDLTGLEVYDRENPNHNFIGPTFEPAFVMDDPRLLIAYGERNGLHHCEVSFSEATPAREGAAIVDALEPWIYDRIEQTSYTLISNCEMVGFKMLISAGSPWPNPRGQFVRILVHGLAHPEDETWYGAPRVFVAETPEPTAEECIEATDASGQPGFGQTNPVL